MDDRASRELARQWDARDPLARFRKQFYRPADQIYLDGDSLGLCSQEAERSLLRMLGDWKRNGSASWGEGASPWSGWSGRLAARVARFVGAQPEEITIANSHAVNLQQLLARLYRRQFHRPSILVDSLCPASDREAIHAHLELRGLGAETQLIAVGATDGKLLDEEKLETALADPSVQLALLPMVVGATGQLLDVARFCRMARRCGVVIGLDLSHSLGVIPHAVAEWDADFALWDHGKFGNAGPGAAAGFYLNRRHSRDDANGAAGGRKDESAILGMAALDGALRVLEEAGIERMRAKSLDLTHFLRRAIEGEIPSLRFASPREPERRGGSLAVLHAEAENICQRLRENGVTAGFRAPDIICLAPSPLYNSFVECWDAVQILRRVVETTPAARSQTQQLVR
jgi:kynureninase